MSGKVSQQYSKQSKMMKVLPDVIDPNMKSPMYDKNNRPVNDKMTSDEIYKEIGEDEDTEDVRKVVFNKKNTTKEEQESYTNEPGTNTMLIIVFALIVIALVALIVWMVMKQNEPKKEEMEMRQRLQQHPRNNMPPYGMHYGQFQQPQYLSQQQAYQAKMRANHNKKVRINESDNEQSDNEQSDEKDSSDSQVNNDRSDSKQNGTKKTSKKNNQQENTDAEQQAEQSEQDTEEAEQSDQDSEEANQDSEQSDKSEQSSGKSNIRENKKSSTKKVVAMMQNDDELDVNDKRMLEKFSKQTYDKSEDN